MPSETKSASQQAEASTGSSNKDHSEKGDEAQPSLDTQPQQEPRRGSATGSGAPKPTNEEEEEEQGDEEEDSDEEPRVTDEVTNHHVLQPGETLDQVPYVRHKATKPMMEINAGSNVWYQATIVHETRNEAKVLFPAPEEGEEDVTQWVHKASNRIWRGSLKGKDWKYLGKGAWAPKKSALAGQGKSGPRKPKRRRVAGQRSGGGDETGTSEGVTGTAAQHDDELASPRQVHRQRRKRKTEQRDPLARWFHLHFSLLHKRGLLGHHGALDSPEAGCLPLSIKVVSTTTPDH